MAFLPDSSCNSTLYLHLCSQLVCADISTHNCVLILLLLVHVILLGTQWDPFCCGDSLLQANVILSSTVHACLYADETMPCSRQLHTATYMRGMVCCDMAAEKCIYGNDSIYVFIASMNVFSGLAGGLTLSEHYRSETRAG